MVSPINFCKVVVGSLLVISMAACGPTPVPAEPDVSVDTSVPMEVATPITPITGDLVVQPESTTGTYDRTAWGNWSIKAGCTTREQILKDSGDSIQMGAHCRVLSGHWKSPYDLKDINNPVMVQIDHIVPLKEAFQSGAQGWNAAQRNIFYNDRDNLVAVSGTSNASKSDSDLAQWLPVQGYVCTYVVAYEKIKKKYALTVDAKENAKLKELKIGCKV